MASSCYKQKQSKIILYDPTGWKSCECAKAACAAKDVALQAESGAESAAQQASSKANQSQAIWNDFQTRYLGAYPSNPQPSTVGVLYFNTSINTFFVWNGSIWQKQVTLLQEIDLDKMFKVAQSSYYHEINYTISGDISNIQVYTNASKTVHLYSRVFTYDGSGNITTITTTDQQVPGVSLTKTITYSGSGDIATVTRNYYGV